jgi:hypothetical protein
MELGVEAAEKEVIPEITMSWLLCSALLAIIGLVGVSVAFGSGVGDTDDYVHRFMERTSS